MPINPAVGSAMIQGGMGLTAPVAGLALTNQMHKKQYHQQKDLTRIQVAAEKELGEFNYDQALKMWEATGYGATRKQMEDAGLNVGLMYGMGGSAGGTTQGGQAGTATGATAQDNTPAMAALLSQGMGMSLQGAQIALLKAQEEKTKAEKDKIVGVDTQKTTEEVSNLQALTQNEKTKGAIMEYEKKIKEIEAGVQSSSQYAIISGIHAATDKLISEAKSAEAQAGVDQQTIETKVKQIKQNEVEQQLRIAGQKLGLKETQMGIQKMAAEIVNMASTREIRWAEIDQQERERWVKEKMMGIAKEQTEFNTSTAAQVKQWTSIVTDVIGAITGAGVSSSSPAGFKY